MEDFWRRARYFGLGLWDYTREKVESLVDELIKRGEVAQQDRAGAVQQILDRAKAEQEALQEKIAAAVRQALAGLGLAKASDLEGLEKRLAALEEQMQSLNTPSTC